MPIVETLMDTAKADTDVLGVLNSHGDRFSVPREVELLFAASSHEKAEIVCGFLNDFQ
jgi:hypothetical protein